MRGDTAAGIRHTCQHWIGGRIPPQDRRVTLRSYSNINNPNGFLNLLTVLTLHALGTYPCVYT